MEGQSPKILWNIIIHTRWKGRKNPLTISFPQQEPFFNYQIGACRWLLMYGHLLSSLLHYDKLNLTEFLMFLLCNLDFMIFVFWCWSFYKMRQVPGSLTRKYPKFNKHLVLIQVFIGQSWLIIFRHRKTETNITKMKEMGLQDYVGARRQHLSGESFLPPIITHLSHQNHIHPFIW